MAERRVAKPQPSTPQQPPHSPSNGGEFLLQLLRRPMQQSQSSPLPIADHQRHSNQYEDPAVAAVGPGIPFSTPTPNFSDVGPHPQLPPWVFPQSQQNAGFSPPGFSPRQPLQPFSQLGQEYHKGGSFPRGNSKQGSGFRDGGFESGDTGRSFFDGDRRGNPRGKVQQQQRFGAQDGRFPSGRIADGSSFAELTGNSQTIAQAYLYEGGLSHSGRGKGPNLALGNQQHHDMPTRRATAEHMKFSDPTSRLKGSGHQGWSTGMTRKQDAGHVEENGGNFRKKGSGSTSHYHIKKQITHRQFHLDGQLEYPWQTIENSMNCASALLVEEPGEHHRHKNEDGEGISGEKEPEDEHHLEEESFSSKFTLQELTDSLTAVEECIGNNELTVNVSRSKDFRSDFSRGHNVSNQRMRIHRGATICRCDIRRLAPLFLSIYRSLVPAEEEVAKQKQLLLSLKKLVNKEWPNAELHLYGSCANSFGFSNSDIDICLAIKDSEMSKLEILLRLADNLQSGNLQNVQALTRARVPIVKLMDPVSGISCDICVNNLLAVVNTKLLRDYAQIDERLRQLAFIVKHWAKSRQVNETYQGTLSSYAYVLMCIHFLQQRRPAILPCLQEMEATYIATVDDVECAYFDKVEELHNYGTLNGENVAELLWGFFTYWAFQHDYTNDVISVRTGGFISKQSKDWTRRIGNDRHLICIEDPFEISHDLGRVVDKHSIRILREEFERAANILQYDPDPSVTLFERYVREPASDDL